MPQEPTRRQFLAGKAVADGLEQSLPAGCDAPSRPGMRPAAGEAYLLRLKRRAMACEFEVVLNAKQYDNGMEAAIAALDVIEEIEGQLTYFRPTSQLSRINLTAADEPVSIEPGLFSLLQLAQKVNEETAGAYDITATPLWEAWGFSQRAGRVPSREEMAQARQTVGGHLMLLDAEHNTVRLLKEGVRLNLASIGKGYALDQAANVLLSAGVDDFLLHGGQSSVLARGTAGLSVATAGRVSAGWSIGLRNPLKRGTQLGEVWLRDRALSTSGAAFQSFRYRGRRYGHVLDPRTGWPAEGVVQATALACTAALAEALSTAFYVMGPDATMEYCRQRPEIGAILMCPGHGGATVALTTAGLREGELVSRKVDE